MSYCMKFQCIIKKFQFFDCTISCICCWFINDLVLIKDKKEGKGWNQDTHMIKQRKYVFPWTLIKTNTNYCQKHCTWKIIEVIYLWLGYIKSWLCRRRSRNIYILFLYIPSTVLPSSCPNENIAQILALSSWRWSFTKGKWTFTTIVHTTN